MENVKTAIPELSKAVFSKRVELDTLYAFDNLIRNSDRGHPKTNLLMSSKGVHLIDHEFALSTQDITGIDLNALQLEDKFTKYHLFFPFLKKARKPAKQNFFNDFTFYLENLSLRGFTTCFDQLVREGFRDYSTPFVDWVYQVKENSNIFVDKLKGSVQ
jgi:hypothetical protein